MIENGLASSSGMNLITVPQGAAYAVVLLTVTNIAQASQSFTIHVVKNGGSVENGNLLIPPYELSTGDVFKFSEKLLLGPGDRIVVTGLDNGVSAMASYMSI